MHNRSLPYEKKLFDAYNPSELVDLFEEQNHRIHVLLNCSTEDLLTISLQLKNYKTQIRQLLQHAESVTNFTQQRQQGNLKNLLQHIYEVMQHRVYTHLDSISQDIFSFNGLLTDITKFIRLVDRMKKALDEIQGNPVQSASERSDKIKSLNALFHQMHSFQQNAQGKKTFISQKVKEKIDSLGSLDYFEDISLLINNQHPELGKYHQILAEFTNIAKRIKSCLQIISKLTIDLQFHDIIHQKLEHIRHMHEQVIKALHGYDEEFLHYRGLIPEVIYLHKALLELSNVEYQSVSRSVIENLTEISKEANSIALICLKFSNFLHVTDSLFLQELVERLDHSIELTDEVAQLNTHLNQQIGHIRGAIHRISDYTSKINIIGQQLESLRRKALANHLTEAERQELFHQIEQLSNQFSEVNEQMLTSFESMLPMISELSGSAEIPDQTGTTHSLPVSMEAVKLIKKITENNATIHRILSETNRLGEEVACNVQAAIGQVKNADIFKDTVNDATELFNEILTNAQLENMDFSGRALQESLLTIRGQYTMQSERDTFDRLFHFNQYNNSHPQPNQEAVEDDIEIF